MNKTETIQGIAMVSVQSGSFLMGHDWKYDPALPETVNAFYPDEQPVHRMTVKAFQLGKTPVTQAEYAKIMGANPSFFTGDDSLPVTNIGPFEIRAFCNKLSLAAGLAPCYDEEKKTCDSSKNGFRLPTEAEWEYSCRAGTTTLFNTGNTERDLDKAGWYLGNSGGKTHPVGKKAPNPWGLYDMHGNVFEFCEDDWNPSLCYGRYLPEGAPKPTFNYYHDMNITRGGSWFSEPSVCRSATRSCFCGWKAIQDCWYVGFRLARNG